MNQKTDGLTGPAIMILSALIFGFVGFYFRWTTRDADGQFVLFPALLGWTLRGSAVLFLASAGLTVVRPVIGNLMYALVGVVGAGLFVVVAVMDIADEKHDAFPPIILLIFAAWNGFGSWTSLRSVLSVRQDAAAPEDPGSAEQ